VKKKIFFATIAAIGLFASASFAQTAAVTPAGKIAYLNLTKVFDSYAKTKEYDAALEKKQTAYLQERKDKEQKILDVQSKLALMKEEERTKIAAQVEKDKVDLAAYDRQQQLELRKERDEKIREILGEIEKVVKEFSQKEGYALILNDRVLIYGTPEIDVTDQITKVLNEKYPAKK